MTSPDPTCPARDGPSLLDVTVIRVTSFVLVGSGWRAEMFNKVADGLPDLSCVGAVVRTPRRAVDALFGSLAECVDSAHPDFVVTAVPWPVTPIIIEEAVGLGLPVLAETPPAPDVEGYAACGRRSDRASWFRWPSSIT